MKLKRFCLALTVALLLLALPMSALALSENKNGAGTVSASAAGTEAFVCHFGGGRRDVRRQSVERALSHLLKACGESGVK